jgi:hypothetical protein
MKMSSMNRLKKWARDLMAVNTHLSIFAIKMLANIGATLDFI